MDQRGQGQQQQLAEAQAELQRRWGAATNDKIGLAQQAAQAIFGDDTDAAMQLNGPDGAIGNNPALLEILAQLGQAMQEGGVLRGATAQPTLTPTDAQEQINQAMLDKDFMAALHDERHMGHKEAYAKWSTLYTAANSTPTGPSAEAGGVFVR
jgi:hypothetical protein